MKTTVNNNPSERSDCVNGKTSHGGSGGGVTPGGGGGVGTADNVNEDDDRFDEEQCNSLNSLTNNGTIYFPLNSEMCMIRMVFSEMCWEIHGTFLLKTPIYDECQISFH